MNVDLSEPPSTVKYVANPYKRRKSIHSDTLSAEEPSSTPVTNGEELNVKELIVKMCREDTATEITILKDNTPEDTDTLNDDLPISEIKREPVTKSSPKTYGKKKGGQKDEKKETPGPTLNNNHTDPIEIPDDHTRDDNYTTPTNEIRTEYHTRDDNYTQTIQVPDDDHTLDDDLTQHIIEVPDNHTLDRSELIEIPDSDESPGNDSLKVVYEKLNLNPADTISPPGGASPISLPRTPDSSSSLYLSCNEDGKRSKSEHTSPGSAPGSGRNSLGIYAEATEQSRMCKPQLSIVKQCLSEQLRCRLLDKYEYLFTSSSDEQESKLKEYMEFQQRQIKFRDRNCEPPGHPKIKKTPTIEELRLRKAKERERLHAHGNSTASGSRLDKLEELNARLEPPLHKPPGYRLSEPRPPGPRPSGPMPSGPSYRPTSRPSSDSDSEEEVEIIEKTIDLAPASTVSSLKQAYEEQFRRNGHAQPLQRPSHTMHTYRSIAKTVTDTRDPLPTMLTPRGHYEGIYNYITKEHDYSTYYSRPKNVPWSCVRHVPKLTDRIPKHQITESLSTTALCTALPRPSYVMSEPWLFVPSLDDVRYSNRDYDEFQKALGFETVLLRMLQKDVPEEAVDVECAMCGLDFSCEWFSFMSKRLCRFCYKKEVKSRNSIIYMTNMAGLARKSHSNTKQHNQK